MNNTIDFSKSVYEIIRGNPEIIEIMKELGFENISNEAVLNTAGRFMTIPKGAEMKKISMEKVRQLFMARGYTILDRS